MFLKKTLLISTIATLSLSACTEFEGVASPDDPNRRTKNGAVIGALAGAATGLIKGDTSSQRREQAVVGALIGAGVGGAIGARLDRQAQDLRDDFSSSGITIENTGSELIVTMPQDVLFGTDRADVRADLKRDLRALAGKLQSYPDSTIDIYGHTDDTGSEEYNANLSTRRAQAVASVLMDAGVAPRRLRALGQGETSPIATNETPQGRAKNRRVEFIIRPTNA